MTIERGLMGIVGASGFLGGHLARFAAESGWHVAGFSRSMREPGEGVDEWREWTDSPNLGGLSVVVNLAGEPIDRRWTDERKRRFRSSRIGTTAILTQAMSECADGPRVLLNGSAVGIYGDRGDEKLTEESSRGAGYLAELCRDWESAADCAPGGTRVLKLRTGIVLGRGGQAWAKMRRVFSCGLGGRMGDGCQWMPWVHVDDLVGAMLFSIENGLSGPINGTAPEPERNVDFTRKVAARLGRPGFLPAPEWGLQLFLGEFAGALLASQRAVPGKLLAAGYRFRFPGLDEALADLENS